MKLLFGFGFLISVALVFPALAGAPIFKSSGQVVVKSCGGDCKSNDCAPFMDGPVQSGDPKGCARCTILQVEIPPNAINPKFHCWSTGDGMRGDLGHVQEVGCGNDDNRFEAFDNPYHEAKPNVWRTGFHNRSGDRSRTVEFVVEYTLP